MVLVSEAVEDVVALRGLLLVLRLLGVAGALALLAADDDADLCSDAPVLRLFEVGAGDAVAAALALGVALGPALVAAARVAHAREALVGLLLGERERPEVLDAR